MVSDINKMSRQDLLNCVNNRKNEIAEKLKSGETEEELDHLLIQIRNGII